MKTYFKTIHLETEGFADLINITNQIEAFIEEVEEKNGLLTAIIPGATGAITAIEYESGLIEDFQQLLEQMIPEGKAYEHNKRWGDGNGFSHLRASLIGPSLSVPFKDRRPVLGTWQQIIFCDFDNRKRSRQIVLQILT